MAVDMFLKITMKGGELKGEAQDDAHKGEIDILAWSWGASQSGTTHMGAGGGGGKVNVQDLSVTKYVDKASHLLLQRCCDGEHLDKATLVVRKAGGKPLEYIKIEMEDLLVTAVSSGGSGGEDRLTENITLNFSKVKYIYTPQKEDGSKDAEVKAGWDIAENKSLA